ncbi:unnamed protein product [Closterium sp. Yama58-4]|nr:unnamed protein product [Closterium sp. Yama58-4]
MAGSTVLQSATIDRVTLRSSFIGEPQSLRATSAAASSQTLNQQGLLAGRIVCKESRIGRKPIPVPAGVTIKLDGQSLVVKGPNGELSREYPREVRLSEEGGVITVNRALETRQARAMHGLFRTLTDNMVQGVAKGFEKKLQLVGVGYRAAVDKTDLVLNLGLSHQVRMKVPDGVAVKVEENTRITISGRDKVAVGDFSAAVRKWREPEPYKGKGIKYADEVIRRKEGKVGKKKPRCICERETTMGSSKANKGSREDFGSLKGMRGDETCDANDSPGSSERNDDEMTRLEAQVQGLKHRMKSSDESESPHSTDLNSAEAVSPFKMSELCIFLLLNFTPPESHFVVRFLVQLIPLLLPIAHHLLKLLCQSCESVAEAFKGVLEGMGRWGEEADRALAGSVEAMKRWWDGADEALKAWGEDVGKAVKAWGESSGQAVQEHMEEMSKWGERNAEAVKGMGAEINRWGEGKAEEVKASMEGVGEWGGGVAEGMGKGMDKFGKDASEAFEGMGEWGGRVAKKMGEGMDRFGKDTGEAVQGSVEGMKRGALEEMGEWKEDVERALNESVREIKDWWDGADEAVREWGGGVRKALRAWGKDAGRTVKEKREEALDAVKEGGEEAAEAVKEHVDRARDWGEENVEEVKGIGKKIHRWVEGKAKDLKSDMEDVGKGGTRVAKKVGKKMDKIGEDAGEAVEAGIKGVKRRGKSIGDAIKGGRQIKMQCKKPLLN